MGKKKKRGFNSYTVNKGLINEYGKKINLKNPMIEKYDGDYSKGMIRLRDKVVLENRSNDKVEMYEIVTGQEVDIFENKISEDSNLGKSLLGKKQGDVVIVPTPMGVVEYRIVEIKQKLIR